MKIALFIVSLVTLLNFSQAVCMLGRTGKVAMHARSFTYARSSFSSKSNTRIIHKLERRMDALCRENWGLYRRLYGDLAEVFPIDPEKMAQDRMEKNLCRIARIQKALNARKNNDN
jgi:hypothetical protein